jgi:hypothetical protein
MASDKSYSSAADHFICSVGDGAIDQSLNCVRSGLDGDRFPPVTLRIFLDTVATRTAPHATPPPRI